MTTIADVAPLAQFLRTLALGEPRTHGALVVVPLLDGDHPDPGWLTLDQAGASVAITEVDAAGSVPTLKLANAADLPVLLLDGEELVGAKQNRILNTTVLVAAKATTTIPVSCVEQGRWTYRNRGFASGEASLYARARAKKTQQVTASLRRGLGHRSDQREIWKDVAARAEAMRLQSPTGAMHDLYDHYRTDIEAARAALAPAPGQVGAVVWLSGEWAGLDVLASPALFARAWARLCTGYVADALGAKPGAGLAPTPPEILHALLEAAAVTAPAAGLGEEYRIADGRMHGAALVAEARVAHLMAFPDFG